MIRNKILSIVVVLLMLFSGATLITAAPPEQVTHELGNSGQTKTYRPDSILVRFKPGTPSEDISASHANINPNKVRSYHMVTGLKQLTLPPGISVEKALANYRKNPNVLYAEPDYQYPTNAIPNDTSFDSLWALNNSGLVQPRPPYGGSASTNDADINAQEAWDNVIVPPASGAWNSTTSSHAETIIAVIDSGVDTDHPDLINNMWINPGEIAANGVDDDGNGYIDDIHGWNGVNNNGDPNDSDTHGTHVAGTIAAEGNNAEGVIGAAWHAKIIACRAGTGSSIDSSAAIACLEYLYDLKTDASNPVNVILSNNSWGGTGYSQATFDAIDANRQAGILFVASAGNSNINNDVTPHYPSSYHSPNIISVASTNQVDGRSSFSNYGRRSVLVGAPGETILSTVPSGQGSFQLPDLSFVDYALKQGTSMAAPQVSGLAALIYAQDTNRDWKAIKNLIISSGTPTTAIDTTTVTGRRIRAWDTDGSGAMTCVDQTIKATLQPRVSSTVIQGGQLGLAMLNINCDLPAGNVIVTSSGGVADTVLVDDGNGFDIEAGDGVYSAYWVAPAATGTYTLTFEDGQTASVSVIAGLTPYRQPQSITPVYETFNDYSGPVTMAENGYVWFDTWFPIKFGDDSTGFSRTYIGKAGISFESFPYDGFNTSLPTSSLNTLVAPFWDSLDLLTGSIHVGLTETSPNKHVIEWRNVQHKNHAGTVKFQVVFTENSSDVHVNYFDTTFGDPIYDNGASATIGVQVHNSSATQLSYNTASVNDNTSFLWQTNSGGPTSVNAGVDQNVTGNTTVNLSGSATDPDGGVISYSWAQLSGTAVTLTNANTATPSFIAPNVTEALSFIMTAQDDAGFTGSDQVIINVTAAPTAGVLQHSNTSYSVAENITTATITVSRSSGSTGAVSVDYATANGTATAGSDYTATSGTLNWADGDSADKTFNITIIDDVVDETDETLAINLSNALGGASLGTASATLTITDNDVAGTLSFSASNYTISETGPTATITVSRTGGFDNAVAVNYATANGTATAGSDYTNASGTLNWTNGDSADKTFTINITDDTAYELDETIALSLSGTTNGASLATSSATLTIAGNDAVPGTLALSNSAYSVSENGGSATITVSRIGGTDGAVSVDYATANGSAIAGSDYTANSGTLNWATGDAADKTFTVAITDDASYELDETIAIVLTNAAGGAALSSSNATLTITANDAAPGSLALSNSAYSVTENGGSATITVSRSGGTDGAVSVDFATANGTAIAASDYTATSGTLSWATGDAADKTFSVVITDDTTYELDETIALALSNVTGGASLGTAAATLTITDNDATPGSLAFSATTYTVNENGGVNATITVNRTGGSDGAVSVNYVSANGSATAGSDYVANSGTLSWADGDTANKTFMISITDDATYEGDETVALSLNTATGGSSLGTSSATLTIIENETAPLAGTITFATTSYTVTEAATVVNITASRIGGSTGAVSVSYFTNNISAFAGTDYNALSSTLSWADGVSTDKTITITILDDTIYEPLESFKVTLSNATNGATIGNSIATITISANDATPGSLSFASSSHTVQETVTTASISVNRTDGANGAISVNYATSDGTAIEGSDYSARTGTLNWADGDSSSKTILVPIINDTLYEPDETIALTLSNPSGGVTLGSASTTLTIAANDAAPGTLSLTASTYTVAENGASVSITVSRSGGSDGAVSVNYGSTDGTAIAGSDYSGAAGTLNWAHADSADKSFTINITDNVTSDGDKTVTLNLLDITGGATLGTSAATLTITDNESSNQAPDAPNLVSPSDGATGIDALNMSFTWDTVTDPDGDAVNYELYYCEDVNFVGCIVTPVNTSLSSASMMFGISGGLGLALVGMVSTASRRQRMISMFAVILMALAFSGCGSSASTPVFSQVSYYAGDVESGKTYYWKVVAVDGNGGQTSSPVWSFTTN